MGKSNQSSVSQILLKTSAIFVVLGFISYAIIYYFGVSEFKKKQDQEIRATTEIITQSIEAVNDTLFTLEQVADLRLYDISRAIGDQLAGKKASEITAEQLRQLKSKWGLSDISIFVKSSDSEAFVVNQSSDPKEIGLSSEGWGYWNTAFQQLYTGEIPHIQKGTSLQHFWVGPWAKSKINDTYSVNAYYYDGRTDFIINPYLTQDEKLQFLYSKGPMQTINKVIFSFAQISDIAVINTKPYLNLLDKKESEIIEPLTDMPVLYGTKDWILSQDAAPLRLAMSEQQTKQIYFSRSGTRYQKMYIPLPENRMLLIVLNLKESKRLETNLLLLLIGLYAAVILSIYANWRLANRKSIQLLEADRQRLVVAEEFKRTISAMPNAIYKCAVDVRGRIILTYLEGSFIQQLKTQLRVFIGKPVEATFPKEFSKVTIPFLQRAFEGESVEFNAPIKGRIYQHSVYPVAHAEDPTRIIEVVGYAIDITERIKAEEQIKQLAYFDTVTELPNRNHFSGIVETLILNPSTCCFAILFIDLDNFKNVNDMYGHLIGDKLLKLVAIRLQTCTLTHKDAVIARMGGDEFTILLPNSKDTEAMESVAQHINDGLKHPFMIESYEINITTSIGGSLYPDHGKNFEHLLKNADMAMYQAKQNGKNRYCLFHSDMNDMVLRRNELTNDLRFALQNNELMLYYQPQICLIENRIIGVEALLRWNHPKEGFVSPEEFIPIAEENGFIDELGEWVLQTACMQSVQWKADGIEPLRMSVNLSARQFREKNLLQMIQRVLQDTGMEPTSLDLEITESTSMYDIQFTIETLRKLRELGIHISIDDFGTGYSSMNYLFKFPINRLKIDRSFVNDIPEDSNANIVVKSIINLAKNLHIKVIAEGVENEEQYHYLKMESCDEIQGFLFGKPMKPKEITPLLIQSERGTHY